MLEQHSAFEFDFMIYLNLNHSKSSNVGCVFPPAGVLALFLQAFAFQVGPMLQTSQAKS